MPPSGCLRCPSLGALGAHRCPSLGARGAHRCPSLGAHRCPPPGALGAGPVSVPRHAQVPSSPPCSATRRPYAPMGMRGAGVGAYPPPRAGTAGHGDGVGIKFNQASGGLTLSSS